LFKVYAEVKVSPHHPPSPEPGQGGDKSGKEGDVTEIASPRALGNICI